MRPLDLAMAYKSHGWPVFPTRPKDEVNPETGEILPAKSPYTTKGLKSATKFDRIIERWWSDHPDAMVAVPTGSSIGAWVLDLDVKPGIGDGHDWLAEMEAEYGKLPDTARVRTMNGGTHIFFKHVDGVRNRGKIGLCVDVRGESGYVIAPGSCAADGRTYTWIDHDGIEPPHIAPAPQWLLDLVLPGVNTQSANSTPYTYRPGNNDRYVERAVQDELEGLAGTATGGRGEAVNKSAFSLGTLVGAGALSRSEAEHGLYSAAVANGVVAKDGEREIRAKIKRGLDAGMQQPRHIPEPDNDNDEDLERWMPHKFLAKMRSKAEAVRAELGEPDIEADTVTAAKPKTSVSPKPSADSEPAIEPDTPTQPVEPTLPIKITPFTWKDPKTLPRREFVYGTHLIRKYVSVTVSPGGIGKTSLTIAEALAMVSNKPLLGTKPQRKLNVWLFNAEDPREEMERRIMATAMHFKLSPKDLDGLFLDTGREQSLVIAREERKGIVVQEPIVDAVIEHILRNKIDVMVIDPFVSTHAVSENDNGAIDLVAKRWGMIADVTNCAIEVVHHVRKSEGREVNVEDSRGAVSLLAASRAARVLNRMSEDQATAAGVPNHERFSYFSVTSGKTSMSAMSGNAEWRRLVSVPLGNGAGLSKPQDHAGVVTEWLWPGSEQVADAVTPEQLRQIETLLDNGEFKPAPNAKNWAGQAVAYALGLDIDETADKKRAGMIFKALLKEGKLKEVRERDPISRKDAAFVKSASYEE